MINPKDNTCTIEDIISDGRAVAIHDETGMIATSAGLYVEVYSPVGDGRYIHAGIQGDDRYSHDGDRRSITEHIDRCRAFLDCIADPTGGWELSDDGTLDTVLWNRYTRETERIDQETAAEYREDDGSFTDDGFERMIADIIGAPGV